MSNLTNLHNQLHKAPRNSLYSSDPGSYPADKPSLQLFPADSFHLRPRLSMELQLQLCRRHLLGLGLQRSLRMRTSMIGGSRGCQTNMLFGISCCCKLCGFGTGLWWRTGSGDGMEETHRCNRLQHLLRKVRLQSRVNFRILPDYRVNQTNGRMG